LSVPEAAEQINFNPPDESQHYGADNVHVHGRELTMAELDALNLKKKSGTTDAYFAVLLLKEYTTPEECMNCTVYGVGSKSKGLHTNTLMNIKKGYERFYSNKSWGDAIKAMNNHTINYCSAIDPA
jgi:hypothetical protein